MSKLQEIYNGWKNLIFPSEESEILAIKRAEICAKCPSNIKNTCTLCECYLPAKVRSVDSKCPNNKWINIK